MVSRVVFLGLVVWTLSAAHHIAPHNSERGGVRISADSLGISTTQPEGPYFVRLSDGRFMVPYTATIPGTDVEFTMIPIPGGRFLLGSPADEEGRWADEGPQVEVQIEPFWMGKYEVTWAEYDVYLNLEYQGKRLQNKGKYLIDETNEVDGVTGASSLYDPTFVYDSGDHPNSPAAMMTQFSAKQYTKMLSLLSGTYYRLPTEAEWEYACRAGTTTAWHFGDTATKSGEYIMVGEGDEQYRRQVVGQKLPNAWGLHDMYGNVAEWTLDQYLENGYSGLVGADVNPPLTITKAWQRSTNETPCVLRGGGHYHDPHKCRSASRWASDEVLWKDYDPDHPKSPFWYTSEEATVGFRIMRPLDPPETREAREEAWNAAYPSITKNARDKIEKEGRGVLLPIQPEFAEEIRKARAETKRKIR